VEVVQQEPHQRQVLVLGAVAADRLHRLLDSAPGQRCNIAKPSAPWRKVTA
jgi:hypothetical protein